MNNLLFVYGSLKKDFENHRLLENSLFVESTSTLQKEYEMISFIWYPGVIKKQKEGFSISGELYEISDETLDEIDFIENNGKVYKREEVELENGNKAWMYIFIKTSRYSVSTNSCKRILLDNERMTQTWIKEIPIKVFQFIEKL